MTGRVMRHADEGHHHDADVSVSYVSPLDHCNPATLSIG